MENQSYVPSLVVAVVAVTITIIITDLVAVDIGEGMLSLPDMRLHLKRKMKKQRGTVVECSQGDLFINLCMLPSRIRIQSCLLRQCRTARWESWGVVWGHCRLR